MRNWDRDGKLSPYRNPINNYRYYRVDQIEAFLRAMEGSREKEIENKFMDITKFPLSHTTEGNLIYKLQTYKLQTIYKQTKTN